MKFVKDSGFKGAADVLKHEFENRENQKDDNDLVIGTKAGEVLKEICDSDVKVELTM